MFQVLESQCTIRENSSINPPMISTLEDRLTHVFSQFHTPNHPPYAAMIQSALLELNERGGSTEKSISDLIKRQYTDLPWAHCSFLKHHLGLLSENGDIIVTSGFRYSLCGADSSSGSIKGGKKRRRKKCRWDFKKKRNKRQKLATVARSQKENEFGVIKDPSQVKDQNFPAAGDDVVETEIGQNDGLKTPKQDGTIGMVLLQLTDRGENDICSGSKAMAIDPPLLVLTGECENKVGIKQQQLHDPCDLNSMELHGWKNNEDGMQELSSPDKPPGFEFMAVDASSSEVSIVNTDPSQISELIATEADILPAPTVSSLPLEKKEQHRNGQQTLVAENLKKEDLPCPLQPIQEKKQEKKKGRQFDKVIEQREVLLALPSPQGESPLLGDGPMQHERSQRQLRRWSVNLSVICQTEEVLPFSGNSGKCQPVEITPEIEKSHALKKLPSEYTFISGRKTNMGSSQRQSGTQQQPVLVSPSPSTDLQQDEGRNSQGVCQQDKNIPLRIYQRRRFRCPKADTNTIIQDELPLADIQKQQAEELPNLPCCHNLQEKTSEAALIKVEFPFPNHKDNSDKDNQLETSKPQGRGRPPSRKLVVNKGKDGQSSSPRNHQQHAQIPLIGSRQSPRNMLKSLYNLRDKKI